MRGERARRERRRRRGPTAAAEARLRAMRAVETSALPRVLRKSGLRGEAAGRIGPDSNVGPRDWKTRTLEDQCSGLRTALLVACLPVKP